MMTNSTDNLALLAGRPGEQEVMAESHMGACDSSVNSQQEDPIHSVEKLAHLYIVCGKESLRPYVIFSVDLAFEIAEDSAGVWYVAAPTKEKALSAFNAQSEEGVISVRILSVSQIRIFADEVERAVLARSAGRKA
jgi:hypothetical protein